MVEVVQSVSDAIVMTARLKTLAERFEDADFKLLVADLTLTLAGIRMSLATLLGENADLKQKLRGREQEGADPCPKCKGLTYHLNSSAPDPTYWEVGGIQRRYKCSFCGFSESRFFVPTDEL
jgi:hypothetical protein